MVATSPAPMLIIVKMLTSTIKFLHPNLSLHGLYTDYGGGVAS